MTVSTSTPSSSKPKTGRFVKWQRRVFGFCLVIFAFELGAFLIVFPWLNSWDLSWVPAHSRELSNIWMSRYFRGALSGLGLLNIYIAFTELIRLMKSIFGGD